MILKKEYGIDEKNLFRNSLGIEKIMMSRYLRKLNIHWTFLTINNVPSFFSMLLISISISSGFLYK